MGLYAPEGQGSSSSRLTQGVDHADATHVQREERVVDGLSALVVHEQVVEHRAQLGRQAGQEVHHTQPCDADLRPGDVEGKQHQEAQQGDAWEEERRGDRDGTGLNLLELQCIKAVHKSPAEHTVPTGHVYTQPTALSFIKKLIHNYEHISMCCDT